MPPVLFCSINAREVNQTDPKFQMLKCVHLFLNCIREKIYAARLYWTFRGLRIVALLDYLEQA